MKPVMMRAGVLACSIVLGVILLLSPLTPFAAVEAGQQRLAADESETEQAPQPLDEALRETAERVVTALRLLLMAIPQYEAPEILDNGDILIRRSRPEPAPAPQEEPMGEAYQQDL